MHSDQDHVSQEAIDEIHDSPQELIDAQRRQEPIVFGAVAMIFAYRRAMREKGTSIERLRVLDVVLDHMNWRLGYSWPSYERISAHAQVPEDTVRKALTWLVDAGIIVRIGMKVPGLPYRRATYRPGPMTREELDEWLQGKITDYVNERRSRGGSGGTDQPKDASTTPGRDRSGERLEAHVNAFRGGETDERLDAHVKSGARLNAVSGARLNAVSGARLDANRNQQVWNQIYNNQITNNKGDAGAHAHACARARGDADATQPWGDVAASRPEGGADATVGDIPPGGDCSKVEQGGLTDREVDDVLRGLNPSDGCNPLDINPDPYLTDVRRNRSLGGLALLDGSPRALGVSYDDRRGKLVIGAPFADEIRADFPGVDVTLLAERSALEVSRTRALHTALAAIRRQASFMLADLKRDRPRREGRVQTTRTMEEVREEMEKAKRVAQMREEFERKRTARLQG